MYSSSAADSSGSDTSTSENTDSVSAEATAYASVKKVVTDNSYKDENINIQITQYRENDTDIYVADITVSSADYLKTAFAQDTYGKNITAKSSTIAGDNNAILAINGDYYGTRDGYVIRNGVLYRETSAGSTQQDLVIGSDGSFSFITEGTVTAQELLNNGAWQVLSFGPALIENGSIAVDSSTEVDQSKTSNPRTAIGEISPLHYVMVVSDGRTSKSEGLSLYELAQFMQTLGVLNAYNLDGGGSSTMVFNGSVVNNPTSDGKEITERKVSDIVYIGY